MFHAAPEYLALAFEQRWTPGISTGAPEAAQAQPRTILVKEDRTTIVADVPSGTNPKMTLQSVLDAVGTPLDGDNCDLAIDGVCPKYRLTGVLVELTLNYFSDYFKKGVHPTQFPELVVPNFDGEPLSIVVLSAKSAWSSTGPEFTYSSNPEWAAHLPAGGGEALETLNRYPYGIDVHMREGVSMTARLDFQAIVNSLIAGVVLLGTPSTPHLHPEQLGCAQHTHCGAPKEPPPFGPWGQTVDSPANETGAALPCCASDSLCVGRM